MMIASGAFAALTFVGLAFYAAMFGIAAYVEPPPGQSTNPDETIGLVIGVTFVIVIGFVMALIYGFIGWGGWNLMKRRSYNFALTGAVLCIVAGIPCSCLPINTLVFMPIGIWSLTVLMDQVVKDNWWTPVEPVYVPPGPPTFIPPSS